MNKLYSSDVIELLLKSFVNVSSHKNTNEYAVELYNRISKASSEYLCHPSPEALQKIILLSAEYQYKYMDVDIHTINNLYGNELDESTDDDLLKQVHRKILELYY